MKKNEKSAAVRLRLRMQWGVGELDDADAGFIGFVFGFCLFMHRLCPELEFDAFSVDFADDVDALITARFGMGDVVLEGSRHGLVLGTQDIERTVDVEFIVHDDPHSIEVIEFFRGGEAFSFEFFGSAFDGFDAVVDRGMADAGDAKRSGDRSRFLAEPVCAL